MRDVYTREETRYLKFGLWSIFIIFALSMVLISSRRRISHADGGSYYSVNARFNRTDGLLVGDLVRLAGMNVGKVIDAQLDENFKAILTLEIRDGIELPDDSSASIVSSGLMGAKYIEIEPGGSDEMIEPNGEFAYTQDAMVIEELLDRIVGIGKANRKGKTCTNNKNNQEI